MKYIIRVNCACFEDIKVEAENAVEAFSIAEKQFQCSGDSPEASEILDIDK